MTLAFQAQGHLDSMEALGGLAVLWHEQQLTIHTVWTAGLLDEIEGDILKVRYIAFVMGYLDDEVLRGDEEEAGVVEQERLPPAPPPPPPQSTPPLRLLPSAKAAKQPLLEQIEGAREPAKGKKEVGIYFFYG